MYWRIPNVKNINANHLFTDEDSFYRFILENVGSRYDDLRRNCSEFYGKEDNKDYFGQIISHLNFSGLLQMDALGEVIQNPLLDYLIEHPGQHDAYFNYFLCMWQFPLPNVPAHRKDTIHKPYLIILKLLRELKKIDAGEAYLTREDFVNVFLDENNKHIVLQDIDEALAREVLDNRGTHEAVEARKTQYFRALLENSDLITTNAADYGADGHFLIGLSDKPYVDREIEYLIKAYADRVFRFDSSGAATDKRVISEYAAFINNFDGFREWKEVVMNIRRIEEFHTYCLEKGYYYTKDLVRRFILSLETKPFVLLTGISGSGKTKIAELWLRFLNERQEGEGILIAVGSNWTDNKKLVGFLNILAEEEQRYQDTQLVCLMKKANQDRGKELIVILDEMNLSRVELYFADFLSALESMDHEILLPDGGKVEWTHNIKIIGTVNVDETTYMFSPKVLDRANVIEMNGMSPAEYIEAVSDRPGKVYKELETYNWYLTEYLPLLGKIYEAVNGEFAYRAIDEISEYLLLNAKVCGEKEDDFHRFMDEQVSQKILSRLHGSKSQLKPKLEKLKVLFDGRPEYALVNAKLNQMLTDIQKGYASYIGG